MFSASYNIMEFLDKAKGNNFQQVLVMADQEATEVERSLYRCKNSAAPPAEPTLREYVCTLKDFIAFLRYGVKTKSVRNLDLDHFSALRKTR